jgi:YfiH family protein
VKSGWRREGGWVRLADWERRFGVVAVVSSRQLGNMKDGSVFRRQCREGGLDPDQWVGGQQVHGARVARVARPREKEKPRTDGVVTRTPGLTLRILTADCVPVFLIDPVRRAMGLVHAGWRGVHKGIVKKAVRRFSMDFQCRTENICVAFGPHIQNCCYDVGPDLAALFQGIPGAISMGKTGGEGGKLSLSLVLRAQLREVGVSGTRLTLAPGCTFCDRTYFSYRRDQTHERQAALLCLKSKR